MLTDKEAFVYALKRLAKQNLPSPKLASILQEREATEAMISYAITECQKLGYLDDRDWVSRFITYQKRQLRGPHRIRQELARRGFPKHDIPYSEEEEEKAIAQFLTKKPLEKTRAIGALQRRGFSLSSILKVLQFDNN
ncbi:MAG: RecX family transcriptional regulator [Chlamydiia bacterium]|nr:RecX family transcriptional regulator [Chlamydiia bacterium]